MGAGHDHGAEVFDGMSGAYRRALWAVIAINAGMFVVEIWAGALAGSQALKADALDFLGDSLTYAVSLAVLGMPLARRATVALAKGVSLLLMSLWVLGSTLWRVVVQEVPAGEIMGVIGLMALCANLASVVILLRFREGDANVRSVWLCSRNDAIGNVAVMVAALLVIALQAAWPDLVVAFLMAGLFMRSAQQIIRQAWHERQHALSHAGHAHH